MKLPRLSFSLRTLTLFLLVVGILMVLLPLAIPFLAPWSRINCRNYEINIRTGQARFSRYLWYTKITEEVTDTPLSLTLEGEQVNVEPIEPWHTVNTLSVAFSNSPHYRFHGALFQANEFKKLCDYYKIPAGRQKAIAREILLRWQKTKSYYDVSQYLNQVQSELDVTNQ